MNILVRWNMGPDEHKLNRWELVGKPIFGPDGTIIGQITDVNFKEELIFAEIRDVDLRFVSAGYSMELRKG